MLKISKKISLVVIFDDGIMKSTGGKSDRKTFPGKSCSTD
jgi:hypothetical protein